MIIQHRNQSQGGALHIPPHKKANQEVFDLVRHLDANPENTRPVHFFFYSDEEGDAYRLASELKELDFKILQVSQCSFDKSQWLCLAELELVPEPEFMNDYYYVLVDLAERFNSKYDGWETRIDL